MRIVLAVYGTRGDVEPSLAVGCELVRRGHDVRVAVPPDMVSFAESAGFAAVAYGPDSQTALAMNSGANLYGESTHRAWQIGHAVQVWREDWEFNERCRRELSGVLLSLTEGADLLFHGQVFEDLADNVAEYYDIPLATLHYIPLRPNGLFLWYLTGTPEPGGDDRLLVAHLAGGRQRREARAPSIGPAQGQPCRHTAHHRARIAGNPGL